MTTKQISLDNVLAEVGNFGKYQYGIITLACLATIVIYMPGVIWIFETKAPNYRCEISGCEKYPVEYKPSWWTQAIPSVDNEPSKCERYKRLNDSETGQCVFDQSVVERCDRYVYATPEISTLHDFGLNCEENLWKLTLVGTMSNTGQLLGLPVWGILSDNFGRKTVLLWSIVLTGLSGIIRSFSSSYIFFLTFTFMDSVLRAGAYPNTFIIGVEFVAPEKRKVVGIVMSSFCGISGAIVGGLAWILQTWRTLDQIMYCLCLLILSYYWLLPESVRWLLTKKRYDEVEKTLFNISKRNGTDLSKENLKKLQDFSTLEQITKKQAFKKLLQSPILTRRYINCIICWVLILFLYYGLTVNSVALSSNSYLDFILTMLVEIPGSFSVFLFLDRVGRRYSLALGFATCGVACLSFTFIPNDLHWLQLCMYLVGKFGTSMLVAIIYIVTSEIFPTILRSSLLSSCSMFGRLGAMAAPQVPLLKPFWPHLPLVLFGTTALLAIISSLLLPETMRAALPDTVEEAENIGKTIKSKNTSAVQ